MSQFSPWLALGGRLILGGTLLAAGLLKVAHPYTSAAAVRAYRLLPNSLATTLGYALPWVEIGVSIALILGLYTRGASIISALLLLAFIFGVASAWARGLTIDCGCFGGGGQVAPGATRYGQEIARDVGLAVIAGFLIWRPRSNFALG